MGDYVVKALLLKELAYENIKERIIDGTLKPGSRLLENELSDEMGISRPPLREAINMLEKDGFVKVLPRRGAVVTEITVEDILSIWEMRMLTEPQAARTATPMIERKELDALYSECKYLKEHLEENEKYREFDIAIHDLPLKYIDNRFLRQTIENMREHSLRIRWSNVFFEEDRDEDTQRVVMQEHESMLNAYRSRDENSAYEAVLRHVYNSFTRIINSKKIELTYAQKKRLDEVSGISEE